MYIHVYIYVYIYIYIYTYILAYHVMNATALLTNWPSQLHLVFEFVERTILEATDSDTLDHTRRR